MPTNANAYNSRVTDESLEKRFRDTFRSQGGSELVDDLYASGVIVPVVDFTAAAEGSQLNTTLQQAWDFTSGTGSQSGAGTTDLITNSGFWLINVSASLGLFTGPSVFAQIALNDGVSTKPFWQVEESIGVPNEIFINSVTQLVVFVRANDKVQLICSATANITAQYRQIATVNGDIVNPSGFVSQ